MDVLKLIVRLRRDITMTDLVAELDYPKSSASRTLSLMAEHGFLERDAVTKAYRPGSVVMEASFHFRSSTTVSSLLEDALDALVADTGFTGYLDVLRGNESVVLQMRPGKHPLQVYTPPGTGGPAYGSSMGRALLSRLTDSEILELVGNAFDDARGLAPKTPKDLLKRIAQTRIEGVAESRGELVPHVAGISAAVLDSATGQIFGIGIAVPEQEVSDALFKRFAARVREAAFSVGKRVGDPYWLQFAG